MKTSTIIWYIVIGVVIYYLIYKAYTNYQASGNIFSGEETLIMNDADNSASRISGVYSTSIVKGYVSGRDCLKMCPSCTWTTNGGCYPPTRVVRGSGYSV